MHFIVWAGISWLVGFLWYPLSTDHVSSLPPVPSLLPDHVIWLPPVPSLSHGHVIHNCGAKLLPPFLRFILQGSCMSANWRQPSHPAAEDGQCSAEVALWVEHYGPGKELDCIPSDLHPNFEKALGQGPFHYIAAYIVCSCPFQCSSLCCKQCQNMEITHKNDIFRWVLQRYPALLKVGNGTPWGKSVALFTPAINMCPGWSDLKWTLLSMSIQTCYYYTSLQASWSTACNRISLSRIYLNKHVNHFHMQRWNTLLIFTCRNQECTIKLHCDGLTLFWPS